MASFVGGESTSWMRSNLTGGFGWRSIQDSKSSAVLSQRRNWSIGGMSSPQRWAAQAVGLPHYEVIARTAINTIAILPFLFALELHSHEIDRKGIPAEFWRKPAKRREEVIKGRQTIVGDGAREWANARGFLSATLQVTLACFSFVHARVLAHGVLPTNPPFGQDALAE